MELFYKRKKQVKKSLQWCIYILAVLASTLAVLLFCSMVWMFRTWQHLNIAELIYHIKAPMDGTNSSLISGFIVWCAVPAVMASIGSVVALIIISKKRSIKKLSLNVIYFSLIAIFLEFTFTWIKLDIGNYLIMTNSKSSFIDDNYVDPASVSITFPEEKRNLIYIYLESMETTFSSEENGGAFKENFIPKLTQIAKQNEDFSGGDEVLNGGYVLNNTTWTMGAMFGQSVGLPLTIQIDNNSMDAQDSFFPGLIAIGDILEEEGYHNSLLVGSNAIFGGRELFYLEHGNYDILDYNYSIETGQLPPDYSVWWGYEDDKLFEHAKEHLLNLSQGSQPFNFTMLTVDTHSEDGYVCEDCKNQFNGNQYGNVISCSDRKVAEFVSWVQMQDFYSNTTIVIVGDHLTMDSNFCGDVSSDYDRRVYTAYINSAKEPQLNQYRQYSTLDFFPTTLSSLGADIEGNRLGLGTDLFSSEKTWIEKTGYESINAKIIGKSELIDRLNSEIDEDTERISEQEKIENRHLGLQENGYVILDISPFNEETGYKEIRFSNWPKAKDECKYICYVWAKENQEDLMVYEANPTEDDSYVVYIHTDQFVEVNSIYNIEVYAVYPDGESEICGATTIEVIE